MPSTLLSDERLRENPAIEPIAAFSKHDAPFNAQQFTRFDLTPSTKGAQSLGLPPPGLAPPPAPAVSPLFYETVRNSQPPNSCPSPSSTGATRGANSSGEAIKRPQDSSPRLTSMSAPRDVDDGDPAQPPGPGDTSTSASFRPAPGVSHPRSFQQRQSFPATPPFYPGRSAVPQEQAYVSTGHYGQPPGPGPGFMGQYMASPPTMSMTAQPPAQFGYSHSFAHPSIHAQDTSALSMPFSPVSHQQNRGYAYQHQPGPTADNHPGEHGVRPSSGYAPPSPARFADAPGPPQPSGSAPPTSGPHMSHHGFSPIHFTQAASAPHYTSYPSQSFTHSTPGLYSFAPAPGSYPQSYYSQSPGSPQDASKGGTWWYLPPGGTQQYDPPPYQGGYPMQGYQPQMTRPDYDPYSAQPSPGGPASPSPAFPGPSSQQLGMLPTAAPHRERSFLPSSPVAARAGPSGLDPPRATASSPMSLKKRSPNDTTSPSPPAASRKSYHPNPPANRSEWVMWVGNVPSDATHDELWRFFNQPAPTHPPPPGTSAVMSSRQVQPLPYPGDQNDVWGGVASVFLISRSNCAFVNFESEHHLERAVQHFNGKPIRPKDPRCPRLVCRVRRKDDDLKAGVGGQRGMGLHTRWVADQMERGREREREHEWKAERQRGGDGAGENEGERDEDSGGEGPSTSPSTYLAPSSSSDPSPPIPAMSPMDEPVSAPISETRRSSDEHERQPRHGSSGDRSFASTNSSFLANNFPKRYFILKSLTQYDLNLSLERSVWATQPHNEGILDQAFRTSTDVFLIFGANKSGEFFGYARMAGPISHGDRVDHVSWASRSSGHVSHLGSSPPAAIKEEDEPDLSFLSPNEQNRMVGESPAAVTPGEEARLKLATSPDSGVNPNFDEDFASAPVEMTEPHKRLTRPKQPREAETLPEQTRRQVEMARHRKAVSEGANFVLNPQALRNATTGAGKTQAERDSTGIPSQSVKDGDGVLRKDTHVPQDELQRLRAQEAANAAAAAAIADPPTSPERTGREYDQDVEDKPEGWGREFKIEWIRTERLPFHRTRHLRNPWNHDREVKVSRDGTEIEPAVGQQLLDEWDKPVPETSPPTSPTSPTRGGRAGRPPVRAGTAMSGPGSAPMPSLSSQLYRSGASGVTSGGIGFGRARGAGPS